MGCQPKLATPWCAQPVVPSGTPKGVVHPLDALQAAAFTSTTTLGFDSSTCWLSCLPLHHIGGFSTLIRAIVCNLAIVVHESLSQTK